jgi:hypothetical protein
MSMADWRAMTPLDWALFVAAWNESQNGGGVEPPTAEQFAELKARYGN